MRPRSALLSCALLLVMGGAAPASDGDLFGFPDQCRRGDHGEIVYAGDTGSEFEACLKQLHAARIRELRISSLGGDAEHTLHIMLGLKLDRVVVDRVCASSCANYVVPAAKELVVLPNSYVLLHGSIDMKQLDGAFVSHREQWLKDHPEIAPAQLDAALAVTKGHMEEVARQQADFEQARLACTEWLHPGDYAERRGQQNMDWLLVTPTMAARCLKGTSLAAYWPPPEPLPDILVQHHVWVAH